MTEVEAKSVVDNLLAHVRVIQAESARRLYVGAAQIGATMALIHHFGGSQFVRDAGLVKQLEYLIDKSSPKQSVRNKLASEWLIMHLPIKEPTVELAQVLLRIDPLAPYPN